MATVTREHGWCLSCGRPAVILGDGLDLSHPIVRCSWENGNGRPHGCGRVPGTRDQGEARTLAWRRLERRRAQAHEAGRHLAKPQRTCHLCAPALIHAARHPVGALDPGCELCAALPLTIAGVLDGVRR